MITLENVSKKIKGQNVLDDVTVSFNKGAIYGIQGKNGAGKTMLLRAISGLINISSGKIMIDGETLHKDIDFPKSIGILIENNNLLPQYSAYKNLELLSKIKKVTTVEDIKSILTDVGLDYKNKKIVRKFSLGMKQRLSIAQAIFEKPEIILLDEPTNALDEKAVLLVRELLLREKERGSTIIIASHDTEDLDILADYRIHMHEGKITHIEEGKEKWKWKKSYTL